MSKRRPSWLWGIEEVSQGRYRNEVWVIYSDGDQRNRLIKAEDWYTLIKDIDYSLRHASAEACRELGMTREIAQEIAGECCCSDIEIALD